MDDRIIPPSSLERERTLKSCRELILKWIKVHYKGYLDKLDDQLFRMAERADNNVDQARYFQAREEINHQRRALEERFLQHVHDAFGLYRKNQTTGTDFNSNDASGFSLVDQNILEEELAIANMSRKAAANCSESLYTLNQRLSALLGGPKISDQGNPAAPGVFAEAVHQAIKDLTLDAASKIIVYKVFDSAVMSLLPKLYDLLNHHLQEKGVLPHLHYSVKKDDAQAAAELPEELREQQSAATLEKQAELLLLIQRLQAQLRSAAGTAVPRHNAGIALQQVVKALQQLQLSSAGTLSGAESPEAVSGSDIAGLRHQLAEHSAQAAQEVDGDVVEIVGLMFEYMLNDERLPDSVKALLSYLHTPFLKVALQDKAFFQHPQHPARQLLNSLVAAGERWVEPQNKHKSDVFTHMRSVVHRVLNDYDDDVRLFSELAFDFNHYLRQHARRVKLSEKRATQAAQGEDKLKEIRQKIDAWLHKKTDAQELPAPVQKLLFEPWANFLTFNLLRFGSKARQWQDAARTVNEVLWFVQPHASIAERARARDMQPGLMEKLRHGFDTVGYDRAAGEQLLAQLQSLGEQAMHSDEAPGTEASDEPAAEASIDEIDTALDRQRALQQDPILRQLSQLEFGTWFLFNADQDKKQQQQLKLAWYNAKTMHFMFVNRLGQQSAVESGQALADKIRQGSVRQLTKFDDKPFFEKALEKVLDQLRGRNNPAPAH